MDTAIDGNVISNPNNNNVEEGILGSKALEKQIRKIICRYGRGCTHMNDPIHRERFWHPSAPTLTGRIFIIRFKFRIHNLICLFCRGAIKNTLYLQ